LRKGSGRTSCLSFCSLLDASFSSPFIAILPAFSRLNPGCRVRVLQPADIVFCVGECFPESVLERDFEKAVIVTDGFASMKPELSEKLKERRLRTLTVLFGNSRDCDDFAQFGDVVQLEDICEER